VEIGLRAFAAFALLGVAGQAAASVPPEVPQNRNYEIFSAVIYLSTAPTYFGEDVVASGGPSCLGYSQVYDFRQTLPPSLVPTARLDQYKQILQTSAGIYYAVSHGVPTRDFAVEIYQPGAAGANAAEAARNAYVNNRVAQVGDIYVYQTSDGANAIWARGALIQKSQMLANATHDISLHIGCHSFDAALAFVNSKHLVRNFAGSNQDILLDVYPSHPYDIANAVFNNMAGIRDDIGEGYKNATFAAGVLAAMKVYAPTNLQSDTAPPIPAASMRLYNAPRIVLSDVDQDVNGDSSYSRQLYHYNPYPTYPYNPNGTSPYPGPAGESTISDSSASIRIAFQFSEPMDTSWGNFVVELRFSDSTTQSVSGSWSTTELTDDTWTGTVTPTKEGQITVAVRARKKVCGSGLDTNNQELDTDGDGVSIANSHDTSTAFAVDSNSPSSSRENKKREPQPSVMSSSNCLVAVGGSLGGIESIAVTGPGMSSTATWTCGVNASTSAMLGPFCNLSEGSYATTITGCNGKQSVSSTTVVAGTFWARLAGQGDGDEEVSQAYCGEEQLRLGQSTFSLTYLGCNVSGFMVEMMCKQMANDVSSCGWYCTSGCCSIRSVRYDNPPFEGSWSVHSTTDSALPYGFKAEYGIEYAGQTCGLSLTFTDDEYDDQTNVSGTVSHAEVATGDPKVSPDGKMRYSSNIGGVSCAENSGNSGSLFAKIIQFLKSLSPLYRCAGSEVVFTSAIPINITDVVAQDVVVDTMTLALMRFDGTQWSSATVSSQEVSYDSGTRVVTASGTVLGTGLYGLFFVGIDTFAPTTTFALQGSSFTFDGATFISTDAYVIFVTTDPVINGFASQVATTYYRIDGASDDPFNVYATSVPLPIGPHVFEYKSVDWAGNEEPVSISTFIVTAGAALKTTAGFLTGGGLHLGYLDPVARVQIEARAENDYTLLVSSPDQTPMLAADNIGNIGLGTNLPQARLHISSPTLLNEAALSLRSGNPTSSTTSVQIAFGYNGEASMRHALVTQHGSSAEDNRMDFYIWNPTNDSTKTIATQNVLALQALAGGGGSMHVCPYGTPDVELEVSSGTATGGGIIRRAEAQTPSSLGFKSDVEYLKEKDQVQAYNDVLALKHVQFRYKGGGTMLKGLIYEEAPKSIRGRHNDILLDERLANVELALQEALKRLTKAQKRLRELEAGGRP
jgi:hypothetical protein